MTENKKDTDLLNDFFKDGDKTDIEEKKKLIKKQKNRKPLPYIIAFSSLAVILGVGAVTYNSWSSVFSTAQHKTASEKNKDNSSSDDKKDKDKTTVDPNEAYDNNNASVTLQKWQKEPYSTQVNAKDSTLKKDVTEWSQSTTLVNVSGMLPSEAEGYTSDVTKATNSDGTPNLKYSYQTKENVEYNAGVYLNKFINPIFGEWASLPVGIPGAVETAFPDDAFSPMFTKEWWDKNITSNDHSKLPIYADWAGDNYGGLDFAPGKIGHWFGKITQLSVTSEPEADYSGIKATVKANIDFVANLKNGSTTTRKGVITLTMEPNKESSNIEYRNILTGASLIISK